MNIKQTETSQSEFCSAEPGLYIVHKRDQKIRHRLDNEDIQELSEMEYYEWFIYRLGKYTKELKKGGKLTKDYHIISFICIPLESLKEDMRIKLL